MLGILGYGSQIEHSKKCTRKCLKFLSCHLLGICKWIEQKHHACSIIFIKFSDCSKASNIVTSSFETQSTTSICPCSQCATAQAWGWFTSWKLHYIINHSHSSSMSQWASLSNWPLLNHELDFALLIFGLDFALSIWFRLSINLVISYLIGVQICLPVLMFILTTWTDQFFFGEPSLPCHSPIRWPLIPGGHTEIWQLKLDFASPETLCHLGLRLHISPPLPMMFSHWYIFILQVNTISL